MSSTKYQSNNPENPLLQPKIRRKSVAQVTSQVFGVKERVMFIVDTSGSMSWGVPSAIDLAVVAFREITKTILSRNPNVYVSIIQTHRTSEQGSIQIVRGMSLVDKTITKAMDGVSCPGMHNHWEPSLLKASFIFEDAALDAGDMRIILFGDGDTEWMKYDATSMPQSCVDLCDFFKTNNTPIHPIYVGNAKVADDRRLEQFAIKTNGKTFHWRTDRTSILASEEICGKKAWW
jgi:hypothetical protein